MTGLSTPEVTIIDREILANMFVRQLDKIAAGEGCHLRLC